MKIGYIGNFNVSFTTENHIAATLQRMEHEVITFQEDQTSGIDLLKVDKEVDFFLFTRTWNNIQDFDLFIKQKTKLLVGFHLDIWWGLPRENEIKEQQFFKCNLLFTADGGHQTEWANAGIEHYWLPPGVVETECYQGKYKRRLAKDIVFVGTYREYHPEYTFRKVLVEWLEKTYGDRFALWGRDGLGTIREKQLNNLYASAKIVVGDSLESDYYWSDRMAETTGRGGFLIHPFVKGMESDGYYDKVNFVGYKRWDFEGLEKTINYYLEHDEKREKIRKAGFEYTKQHRTYKNRMEFLLGIVTQKIGNQVGSGNSNGYNFCDNLIQKIAELPEFERTHLKGLVFKKDIIKLLQNELK